MPLFTQLQDRRCLVVGGGPVAERKVRQLRSAGAAVTVLSPELTGNLEHLARDEDIRYEAREFAAESLAEYWLIIAATSDPGINARVAEAAEAARVFCNVVDDPERSSFIMPAIVDRAPITVAVSSGGHAPVLARWVKGLIESTLPARLGSLALLAGRWREKVRATIGDGDQRRRFWEQVLDGPVRGHVDSRRDRQAEEAMDRALADWQAGQSSPTGEAYLVGAGPGSPDLMTLRGRQLLSQAEVVLYDRLVSDEVLEYARRDAELISVATTPGPPSV